MTVLVDAAIWPWRGRRWAHLISDSSYDELHDFAVSIGVRRVGFQGDHYDVDSDTRLIALEHGAVAADSRLIVRRLRESGLRIAPGQKPSGWQWVTKRMSVTDEASLGSALVPNVMSVATHRFAKALTTDLMPIGPIEAALVSRPVEAGLILSISGSSPTLRREVSDVLAQHDVPDTASTFLSGYGDVVIEVLETLEPLHSAPQLESWAAVSSHR